jgi:hypothetical protein
MIGAATVIAVALGLWAIGELMARALFGPRYAGVATDTRVLLGLASTTLMLEGAGYFVRIGVAAWLPVLLSLPGLVLLARPRSSLRSNPALAVGSALGMLLGLAPILLAGRLTAAAMTNNDATFYLAAADRLLKYPWSVDLRDLPDSCLRERLIRGWYWRTGTSNFIAAVTAVTRLSPTAATSIVTVMLMACVPAPALALLRRLTPRARTSRRVAVAVLASFSGAALFLAYQHLLGQLGAYTLFPVAIAASLAAFRSGGARRVAHAAVLLGAGVAHFADASVVLCVCLAAGVVVERGRLKRLLARATALTVSTAIVAPFTLARAAIAAFWTLTVRVAGPQSIFPQRGWVPRAAFDRLTTLTGVDPWPPWSSFSASPVQSILSWAGACAACVLAAATLRRAVRARELFALAVVVGTAIVVSALFIRTSYVTGKAMLLGASFVVPLVAAGTALGPSRLSLCAALFFAGELSTFAEFMRPSRWTVIDRPDHDRMLPELARVPAGSLLMLDGFGAPADPVLDAHRAYRAAQLAGLLPIHAGLDGGFYRPRCADPPRPEPLPARAFALTRRTTEQLSRGKELSAWGDFRLLAVDFSRPDDVLATFAPTHGFLAAEVEPVRGVFRWAGWRGRATVRVVSGAPCFRLDGELRTTGMNAQVTLTSSATPLFEGPASGQWTPFRTLPLEGSKERTLDLSVERVSGAPLDESHAVALRALHVEQDTTCATFTRSKPPGGALVFPLSLDEDATLELSPAAGVECAAVTITVVANETGALGASFDRAAVEWLAVLPGQTSLTLGVVPLERTRELRLIRRAPAPGTFRILGIAVSPKACVR